MGKLDEILKDITFKPGEQVPAAKEGEPAPEPKIEDKAGDPAPDKVEDPKKVDDQEIDFSKVPEEKILGYLAGKVGKEVKTWDDLVEIREVEKEVEKTVDYASPDVANIDKFVRETGRGVDDYFKVQKDWDNEPNEKVVKEYLKTQYPSLDKEDIEVMYEDYFQTEEVYDEEFAEGFIVDQSLDPGEEISRRTSITLYVSKGSEMEPMPNLIGKTAEEAVAQLTEMNKRYQLVEGTSDEVNPGEVFRTDPAAGTELKKDENDLVLLYVAQEQAQTEDEQTEEEDGVQILSQKNSDRKVIRKKDTTDTTSDTTTDDTTDEE